MLDDRELRRRYAAAATAPRTPHLDEAAWERLAMHEMDDAERATAVAHITECAECGRAYRAVQALAGEAREFDPAVPAVAAMPRTTARFWMAGSFAAAAAFAGWALMRPMTPRGVVTEVPAAQGGAAGEGHAADGVRGHAAEPAGAPRPSGPLGTVGPPVRFRWDATADARSYRVRLLRADGTAVWTSPEVVEPEVVWPADVPATPGDYLWRVEAVPGWGDAADAASSPVAAFTITASPR
jgi:hypothetical protein